MMGRHAELHELDGSVPLSPATDAASSAPPEDAPVS